MRRRAFASRSRTARPRPGSGWAVPPRTCARSARSCANRARTDKRERLIEQVQGTTHKVGDATPDGQEVKEGARQVVGIAQENPLGLAIGGIAAGFLAGMVLPSNSAAENAQQVKEQART